MYSKGYGESEQDFAAYTGYMWGVWIISPRSTNSGLLETGTCGTVQT